MYGVATSGTVSPWCSASILSKLSDKFVATIPPGLSHDEAIFDDPEKYPESPYALVGVARNVSSAAPAVFPMPLPPALIAYCIE